MLTDVHRERVDVDKAPIGFFTGTVNVSPISVDFQNGEKQQAPGGCDTRRRPEKDVENWFTEPGSGRAAVQNVLSRVVNGQ